MKLTVKVEGHTLVDLELALAEAIKKVSSGYTSGFDENETGSYDFSVVGEEVHHYRLQKNSGKLSKKQYATYEAMDDDRTHDRKWVGIDQNDNIVMVEV